MVPFAQFSRSILQRRDKVRSRIILANRSRNFDASIARGTRANNIDVRTARNIFFHKNTAYACRSRVGVYFLVFRPRRSKTLRRARARTISIHIPKNLQEPPTRSSLDDTFRGFFRPPPLPLPAISSRRAIARVKYKSSGKGAKKSCRDDG